MYGDKIYNAFRELKKVFDPYNLMNPGKITDSQDIDENLKIGPKYKTFNIILK